MKTASSLALLGLLAGCASAFAETEPLDLHLEAEARVTSRTIPAVNFRQAGGVGTHMAFKPTDLAPEAAGGIDIDAKEGYVQIQSTVHGLPPAASFGDEYMTYVMWAITPEGRATNLGELIVESPDDSRSHLEVTSELQAFGMIVTAEPHFAVTMPSDVVVLEAALTPDTKGRAEPVVAEYKLLERGSYAFRGESRTDIRAHAPSFYVIQARNAKRIAEDGGARENAAGTFAKADALLTQAEAASRDKDGIMLARQSAQTFEDARKVAEVARREAHEAEMKATADAASARAASAEADADAARSAQAEADAGRKQAEAEQAALREKLRQQFVLLFETRQTARGLILSMSNVLFDFDKSTLRPEAREKLAKLAGILVATPGLHLGVEGHADAIGSDEYNQALSERRAESVKQHLVTNGVPPETITTRGYGESQPIASNDTEEGRRKNRRVEIVVSGDVIGFGF